MLRAPRPGRYGRAHRSVQAGRHNSRVRKSRAERPPGNRQNAVARAMQQCEGSRGTSAKETDHTGTDRMCDAGKPGRHNRMKTFEKARFHDTGANLGGSDHHAGKHRLRGRCSESFDDPRQMGGHGRCHRPGRRESERQQNHRPIDRNMRFDDRPFGSGSLSRPAAARH